MSSNHMRLVVSTVGASLVRFVPPVLAEQLKGAFNEHHLAPDVEHQLQECLDDIVAATLPTTEIRQRSAELNGLFAFYDGDIQRAIHDHHRLIATDTAVGRACALAIQNYLQRLGATNVQIQVARGLTTASAQAFSFGIKDLIYWCETTLPGYHDQGYFIIFNLVAAFKALQGYLTTIGMFYADEIIYLFEGVNQLITIPRLPIKIDDVTIHNNATIIALLAENPHSGFPYEMVQGLASTFYEEIDGKVTISDWGTLIWNRVRRDIYSEKLLAFPRLTYAASFIKDYEKRHIDHSLIFDLQKTLAQLSCIMITSNGDTSALKGGKGGGLLAQEWKGKQFHGEPLDHLRLGSGLRIFFQGDHHGGLRLIRFGPHDIEKEME